MTGRRLVFGTLALPYDSRMDAPKISLRRAILVLSAVTALMVGGYISFRNVRQQAAVAQIQRLGGRVRPLKRGPGWLRRMLPDRMFKVFDGVYLVNLRGTEATDADFACLEQMRGLQRLNLSHTRLTDAGLIHLEGLNELKALDLSDTQVSDAGLASLSGLSRLEYLYLDRTAVTDAGLVHLHSLSHLQHLSVEETGVTDRGIAGLEQQLKDEGSRQTR